MPPPAAGPITHHGDVDATALPSSSMAGQAMSDMSDMPLFYSPGTITQQQHPLPDATIGFQPGPFCAIPGDGQNYYQNPSHSNDAGKNDRYTFENNINHNHDNDNNEYAYDDDDGDDDKEDNDSSNDDDDDDDDEEEEETEGRLRYATTLSSPPPSRRTAGSATGHSKRGNHTHQPATTTEEAVTATAAATESFSPRNPDHRVRNRMAANKCRRKTRDAIDRLEEETRHGADLHDHLAAQAAALRSEIYDLNNMLLRHDDCDCVLIQQYLRNTAAAPTAGRARAAARGAPGPGGDGESSGRAVEDGGA